MTKVVALIHGKAGNYGISFPDFPGVASGGDTLAEALRRGAEGLQTHVAALIEEGLPVPAPRSMDAIADDAETAEEFGSATVVAMADIELPRGWKRYNISMDEGLMERIDAQAAAIGESRSAYLAGAARRRLTESA